MYEVCKLTVRPRLRRLPGGTPCARFTSGDHVVDFGLGLRCIVYSGYIQAPFRRNNDDDDAGYISALDCTVDPPRSLQVRIQAAISEISPDLSLSPSSIIYSVYVSRIPWYIYIKESEQIA